MAETGVTEPSRSTEKRSSVVRMSFQETKRLFDRLRPEELGDTHYRRNRIARDKKRSIQGKPPESYYFDTFSTEDRKKGTPIDEVSKNPDSSSNNPAEGFIIRRGRGYVISLDTVIAFRSFHGYHTNVVRRQHFEVEPDRLIYDTMTVPGATNIARNEFIEGRNIEHLDIKDGMFLKKGTDAEATKAHNNLSSALKTLVPRINPL